MDVEELAPDVRHAGDLGNAVPVQLVEPGIAIGMDMTDKAAEMRDRALALSIGRITEQRGRWGGTAVTALVADIDVNRRAKGALTQIPCRLGHAGIIILAFSRLSLARPYIWRLMDLRRQMVPSA
ncbi:hypothetical protein HNO88_003622 [Novosphingobium chloroacetimidivorans]|uniref:Uncharacterized protein n=1 Tax=Novosphingobium chloroacetimidivorans TaxID=1428314 RepID=A0A7W7KCF7_9SPHN|nr:hypothetical protein [Novosphingobium chloroacetimidivorans]